MLFTMKLYERPCTFMDFHGQFQMGRSHSQGKQTILECHVKPRFAHGKRSELSCFTSDSNKGVVKKKLAISPMIASIAIMNTSYRWRSGEIMYLVASVRPFVCLSELSWLNPQIWSKGWSLPVRGFCLCVCNQESEADNLADAVDQLLKR